MTRDFKNGLWRKPSPCPQPDLPTPVQWCPTFLHVPLEYLHASSSRQSPRLVRQVLRQLLKAPHLSSVCGVRAAFHPSAGGLLRDAGWPSFTALSFSKSSQIEREIQKMVLHHLCWGGISWQEQVQKLLWLLDRCTLESKGCLRTDFQRLERTYWL